MSAFTIAADRSALLKAVATAARAVERRTSIPILSFVKLEVAGGRCAITATNLEHEIRTELDAEGEGAACVPAARLRDLLKAMSGVETVTVSGASNGRVTLVAPSIEATFMTLPAADFPDLKIGDPSWSLSLPEGVTAFLIGGAADVVSCEETRYYLNGVCLEVDDGVARATATDGHRLVSRSTHLEGPVANVPNHIIPRGAVKLLLPQVGRGEAVVTGYGRDGKQAVEFVSGGVRIRAKAIDGTFPNWRRVVPNDVGTLVEVSVADLRRSLAMAQANTDTKGRAVKIAASEGGLKVSSESPDSGSMAANLPGTVAGVMTDFGVNSRYLDGFARAMERLGSKTIRMEVLRSGDPLRIMPDPAIVGTLAILMPMRV